MVGHGMTDLVMSDPIIDMSGVKRALVIKMSALGDIARTIPTVDSIRAAFPDLRIGWVVRKGLSDLLEGNPSIDELFVAPRGVKALQTMAAKLREFRPEVVLDMQGLFISGCLGRLSGAQRRYTWESGRELSGLLAGNPIVPAPTTLHANECLFNFARLMGVERLPATPPGYLTCDTQLIGRAETLLASTPRPCIGMHIGASVANKTWPAKHWAELGDRLLDRRYGVVLFGGPDEVQTGEQIQRMMQHTATSLVGRTTPRELACAISRCRLFVGGDTGATHIASLVHTPTVALMGATDPGRVGPYGREHTVIYLGLECSPCWRRPTCGGRYECMSHIDADRVYRTCLARLSE